MKNNSIKKNLVFNIMYQALVTLTPLITTPYVSRVLGADNIGEYPAFFHHLYLQGFSLLIIAMRFFSLI